jgi:disease resistance protein RPM1
MAEALILVLLQKITTTLGGAALRAISSQLGKETTILLEVQNSVKEIESEFDIVRAFISQVDQCGTNNKILESWLKHIRKVALEVEDIIDEYAFLLGKKDRSERSLRKAFNLSTDVKIWNHIASQLKQLKTRLESLTIMKERFGIKTVDHGETSSSQYINHHIYLSKSSYLNDDDAMVGHEDQARRLTECLDDQCRDRTVLAIWGMGGSGKTTLASSIYKKLDVRKNFDCHLWISVSQNYQVDDLLSRVMKQLHGSLDDRGINDPRDMVARIQHYLGNRRYLIVVDDMWDRDSWMVFDHAFINNKLGSRVIITTRNESVALLAQQQQQQHSLLSQASWGRLEMKPKRDEKAGRHIKG